MFKDVDAFLDKYVRRDILGINKPIVSKISIPSFHNQALRDLGISLSDKMDDTAYMKAAESGDTETAQKMVDEAAETALSESKARGEDGKLVIIKSRDIQTSERTVPMTVGYGEDISTVVNSTTSSSENQSPKSIKDRAVMTTERIDYLIDDSGAGKRNSLLKVFLKTY